MGTSARRWSSTASRVVQVHDRARAVVRGEQHGLRLEVVVHVAVEVEVVVREVREDGHGEAGRPHSPHGERVRRHLHGHGPCPRVALRRQVGLQLGGLGRRARPGERAQHRGPPAVRREDRSEEVGGGRLAARAGDADDVEVIGGVAPEGRRDRAEGVAHGRGSQLRQGRRQRALHEEGHGTAACGLVGEVVAVDRRARHAAEERARLHGPASRGPRSGPRRPALRTRPTSGGPRASR